MNAEILAVGTELLMGQIVNTNARYISERLNSIGINVYFHSVVGDNPERLKSSLEIALKRAELVIMTGGLGPTQDDLTKETAALMFGKKLVLHEKSLEKIEYFFKKLKRKMTDNNKKQAYLPEDSIIIENNNGTAPGCIMENDNKIIIMLPGPPSEMMPMFEDTVIPYLINKCGHKIVSKYLRAFGIGESQLEDTIMDLIDVQDKVTIATYAKEGEVTIRLTSKALTQEDAIREIEPYEKEIITRLKGAVYSTENEELEEVAAKLLMEKNISVSFAESCTGGLISYKLTKVPGISKVFKCTVVSYSNESKIKSLGVKGDTIEKYGEVSRETAVEMAEGIRKIAGTDIGVAVTGIAGPEGGTAEKPVGLVYLALSDKSGTQWKELKLWGGREKIRNMTSLFAFNLIRELLIDKY